MFSTLRLGIVASLLSLMAFSQGAGFRATVVSVADGDTFTAITASHTHVTVRLIGVDAPEKDQPFGAEARKFLETAKGKTVTVVARGRDDYGRTLGDLYIGETWINGHIVSAGLAWHYERFSDDARLKKCQQEAKARKAGLWAAPNPVPPWEWRKTAKPAAGGEVRAPTTPEPALTHWITIKSRKRHNSSCRYYMNSKGRLCGPNEGVACKLCGG
jgi:endonuclease YncB( thermonuclease family)